MLSWLPGICLKHVINNISTSEQKKKLTARQEEVIRIQQLETKQRKYTLHREGTPVNEIAVEQVGILFRGQTIDLEYVHQVVELTVNVATNRELLLIRHSDIHQRGLSSHIRVDLAEYLKQIV